jgi:4,5-DOPA dioxygenase extradiol
LADRVRALLGKIMPIAEDPRRGLDHGAYVPLLFMYPDADVPVLQISMPSENPLVLLEVGRRLAPLRDEGVLIMGSGFLTHSFQAFGEASLPNAIREFDAWAAEVLAHKDLDALVDFRRTAPGLGYAHRTLDHFVPLFVALGASLDSGIETNTAIEGYWFNNSKRSVEIR